MRHVLDAICHMRINLRETGDKCARAPARCGKRVKKLRESCESARSLREANVVARNMQGLRSWFKLQEI
jgi:hypothetical protein